MAWKHQREDVPVIVAKLLLVHLISFDAVMNQAANWLKWANRRR